MRYLHVLDSLAGTGVETIFLQMLRVFRATASPDGGSDVHDVVALATGPLHRDLTSVAHRVMIASLPLDVAGVLASDYDVVHVLCERAAHRVAPILLAGSDAALVYSKHYDPPALSRMYGAFDDVADESLLSASDAVTFTTLDLAAGYRLPPGRTTILRAAAVMTEALQLPPVAPDLPPRILAAAPLHPRERLTDLIPIMQIVRERVPRADLRILGGGTPAQAAEIQDRIADAGLAGVIRVTNPSNGLASDLAQARVLALPAAVQGVPVVAIEAMAAARPVVAARLGHIGHVLTDGVEGFLPAAGDHTAFADRLITVLTQPDAAWHMGSAARQRAGLHDVRLVAADLLRVLRRAATARRRAAA